MRKMGSVPIFITSAARARRASSTPSAPCAKARSSRPRFELHPAAQPVNHLAEVLAQTFGGFIQGVGAWEHAQEKGLVALVDAVIGRRRGGVDACGTKRTQRAGHMRRRGDEQHALKSVPLKHALGLNRVLPGAAASVLQEDRV